MTPKKTFILLLYILITQATPWTPSLYTFIIDFFSIVVSNTALTLIIKFYNSIPISKKTILHGLMKVLVISYGFLITIKFFTYSTLNLVPQAALSLLYKYPIIICWGHKGFVFDQIFFFNIMLLIILRAFFNCYPNMLFNLCEKMMWFLIVGCNMIYLIQTHIKFYQQSKNMCTVRFIEMLKVAMKLEIDDTRIATHSGLSILTILALLLAPFAEILSRITIKARTLNIKEKFSKRYLLENLQKIPKLRRKSLKLTNIQSLTDQQTPERIFTMNKATRINGRVPDKSSCPKNQQRELVMNVEDISDTSHSNKSNNKYATHELGEVESLGLQEIRVIGTDDQIRSADSILNTNVDQTNESQCQTKISIGMVGLNLVAAIITMFIALRIIRQYDIVDKDTYVYISLWLNLKIGKLVETLLPLYWLLKKQPSKEYAVRKLKMWWGELGQTFPILSKLKRNQVDIEV
jgi:hypothetical protein